MCVSYDCGHGGGVRSAGGGIGTAGTIAAVALGTYAVAMTDWSVIVEALQRAALWATVAMAAPLVGYVVGALLAHFDLVSRARTAVHAAIVRCRLHRALKADLPALGAAAPLALPAAHTQSPLLGEVVSGQPVGVRR